MKPYALLDHTADLKVEIYGRDLKELFANAGFMIFDMMVDLKKVREARREEVNLISSDLSELFLDWLRELLYLFSAKGFVTRRVEIEALGSDNAHLSAFIYGEDYDPKRQGLKIEIKTPTYHQYSIEQTIAGYKATVVFDV